jgi:hypothetical protein
MVNRDGEGNKGNPARLGCARDGMQGMTPGEIEPRTLTTWARRHINDADTPSPAQPVGLWRGRSEIAEGSRRHQLRRRANAGRRVPVKSQYELVAGREI